MSEAGREIAPDLQQWIAAVTGARAVDVRQVAGGASREAWFVDAHADGEVRELFLRYDRRAPDPYSAFHPLQVEAQIMAELHRHGVTVPAVVAVHPEQQAVLLERVGGATWFRLIADPDEQVRTAQDFIAKLAYLHRLDPHDFAIPALGPVRAVREHVHDEIAAIRRRLNKHRRPAPLLLYCADWLERNVPDYDGPAVLVQGDTGPGNFMYDAGRVTAIVDWELAHYGDPMDDIAWLSLRTVQDTFTDFASRLAEYEKLSGHRIDESRVWYYRLFAETRLASMNPSGIDARAALPADSPDAGNRLIYGMLHRRLLVEALAHVIGLPDVSVEMPGAEQSSPYQAVYDATASVLKAAAERSGDALAQRYVKGAARLVKYLAEVDRIGAVIDRQEIAELAALLGSTPASVEAGRSALAERAGRGELDDRAYVTQLWRGIKRDDYLMRAASGALRNRTWPPLSTRGDRDQWASQSPKTTAN
ncbi:phosphotransferase [Mycobacterium alsense]|uniref:phosphotransferase family protein n=1 Tax=Mycobacterium alsense TaxID=324058 RepID=UPI0007FB9422|nr:phosphotransferase family protein [Mycobacterium alsense]OBI99540.1 phosphotransferase [Mycobacterium alsense]